MYKIYFLFLALLMLVTGGCQHEPKVPIAAREILGNPSYQAFSYGGYRNNTREDVPTVEELKEDLLIMSALDIKLLRTYNTQQFAQAANLLEAIKQLKAENPEFEMYVMLGAWIDCEGAWTANPNHNTGDEKNNSAEVNAAVKLANEYANIVKMIAVGNEAMVHWATSYFVYPDVILKWVNYLKNLRDNGKLPNEVWITSSDNFASWGGGESSYHTADLASLVEAVDFISVHTYPFHDSHYQPAYWGVRKEEENLSNLEKIEAAMLRAKNYAMSQYQGVVDFVDSLGLKKPIHIGETGWATTANIHYGGEGSKAADEYKEKLYYDHMREWTNEEGITCFYFEAFDEKWKDPTSAAGSENHFGLINLQGEAKYALWEEVNKGSFKGLTRGGKEIQKTYGGDKSKLMENVLVPPTAAEIAASKE